VPSACVNWWKLHPLLCIAVFDETSLRSEQLLGVVVDGAEEGLTLGCFDG